MLVEGVMEGGKATVDKLEGSGSGRWGDSGVALGRSGVDIFINLERRSLCELGRRQRST